MRIKIKTFGGFYFVAGKRGTAHYKTLPEAIEAVEFLIIMIHDIQIQGYTNSGILLHA